MYKGPITEILPLRGMRYVVGLGDVGTITGTQTRTLERYQCERCGREYRVLGRATEPFYCRECPSTLIDITKEPTP